MTPEHLTLSATAAAVLLAFHASADTVDDARAIAAMDTQYQAAVESNDWRTMDRILHSDFVLVLGNGVAHNRERLIDNARNEVIVYDKQVEEPGTQVVRMYGNDTATVTALLWCKGTRKDGKPPFDFKLWFTDTYVRTADGWRYAFGQASMPIVNKE
jgi:ketosteroid isomerase-like protein